MLNQIAKKHLLELQAILAQVHHSDYNRVLSVLDNGTLGKHVRHVLEFFECLFFSVQDGVVCYDDRKRNLELEEQLSVAISYIDTIIGELEMIETDRILKLKSRYRFEELVMPSSLYREITYNIEHTVHHLAIIRIAALSDLKYIKLSSTFGYADSTIQFLESQKVNA